MVRFVLTRIASAVPTLILVSVAVFVMMRFVPGDPATLMLGDLAQPG
ncbi:MAG: ABC transporter permease, partial [Mesorhizobium sp.]